MTKTHKKKKKEEDEDEVVTIDWRRCGQCHAHRNLDMYAGGNETCNECLGRSKNGLQVRKCKWGKHILTKKRMMGVCDGKDGGDDGGGKG